GLFHSLMMGICQEDNLTQRRKGAKENRVFGLKAQKFFTGIVRLLSIFISLHLAISPILRNETALLFKGG
ncbi:MAG: hypothetical protein RM021_006650, partial [Nostoc sp. EkiNYC01]|nr:hypothetical protein [Nostoc sp. EkiNYC01]